MAIARHEAIVHQIFEAGLALQGALHLITDPDATERIHGVIELLDDTLKALRLAILDLSPEAQPPGGRPPAEHVGRPPRVSP